MQILTASKIFAKVSEIGKFALNFLHSYMTDKAEGNQGPGAYPAATREQLQDKGKKMEEDTWG